MVSRFLLIAVVLAVFEPNYAAVSKCIEIANPNEREATTEAQSSNENVETTTFDQMPDSERKIDGQWKRSVPESRSDREEGEVEGFADLAEKDSQAGGSGGEKRVAGKNDGGEFLVNPTGKKEWKRAIEQVEGSGEEESQIDSDFKLFLQGTNPWKRAVEQVEGSGEEDSKNDGYESVVNEFENDGSDEFVSRMKRQIEGNSAEVLAQNQLVSSPVVLGEEQPVAPAVAAAAVAAPAAAAAAQPFSELVALVRRGHHDSDEDRRRPHGSCATVRCIPGTRCIMERGRPTCVRDDQQQPQRTCRDVNCPHGSRCRMERDPRCNGRHCTEQPVCVRETSSPSCNNVRCPSGTRCRIVEEPGCFGRNCREIATCIDVCDRVRCPVGTVCRTDGRGEPSCIPVVINPCMTARCPNGYQCQVVHNQARCVPNFATTMAPPTCPGRNEEMKSCASPCEPTCTNKNPACTLNCLSPRCQCAFGFYRNNQGVCVRADQCEQQACGQNEEFNACGNACEPKCGQIGSGACPLDCMPGKCACKQGFYRHFSGSCVMQNQCFSG